MMHDWRTWLLAAIALLATAAMLLCGTGCATVSAKWNLRTPGGIEVSSKYAVDLAQIDCAWEVTLDCWQIYLGTNKTPEHLPRVIIFPPLESGEECKVIDLRGIKVHGWRHGRLVGLPPDLCAAGHEFSHYISEILRSGNHGYNGEGICGL